jgi:hypothetical protein
LPGRLGGFAWRRPFYAWAIRELPDLHEHNERQALWLFTPGCFDLARSWRTPFSRTFQPVGLDHCRLPPSECLTLPELNLARARKYQQINQMRILDYSNPGKPTTEPKENLTLFAPLANQTLVWIRTLN